MNNAELNALAERAFSYRSQEDMHDLAGLLLAAPADSQPQLCAFIVDHDLMRPQWWIRALLALVRWRHGHTVLVWHRLEETYPGNADELIRGTADHIRFGKDRTTRDAYGGFNQGEVDLLAAALATITNGGQVDSGEGRLAGSSYLRDQYRRPPALPPALSDDQ